MMKVSVYVKSLDNTGTGVVAVATNGGADGSPFVRFKLPVELVQTTTIGAKFMLTIDKED